MILEVLAKYVPAVAIILGAAMGYGEIKSDLANLKITQNMQYESIQNQLDNINARLNQIQSNPHARN